MSPIGEGTILAFDADKDDDEAGPVVVGFAAWCLRKERVEGPKPGSTGGVGWGV